MHACVSYCVIVCSILPCSLGAELSYARPQQPFAVWEGPSELPTIDFAPNSAFVSALNVRCLISGCFSFSRPTTFSICMCSGCSAEEWGEVGSNYLPYFATNSSELAGKHGIETD